jgi:hypothetical protein
MAIKDWRTLQLIGLSWGPWLTGAIAITVFYYALVSYLFGQTNFYLQGILAGFTGGMWGYGMTKGYEQQDWIENHIDEISVDRYAKIRDKCLISTGIFSFILLIEAIILAYY